MRATVEDTTDFTTSASNVAIATVVGMAAPAIIDIYSKTINKHFKTKKPSLDNNLVRFFGAKNGMPNHPIGDVNVLDIVGEYLATGV